MAIYKKNKWKITLVVFLLAMLVFSTILIPGWNDLDLLIKTIIYIVISCIMVIIDIYCSRNIPLVEFEGDYMIVRNYYFNAKLIKISKPNGVIDYEQGLLNGKIYFHDRHPFYINLIGLTKAQKAELKNKIKSLYE